MIAAGYKYVFPLYVLDLLKNLKIFKSLRELYDFTREEDLSLSQFFDFFSNSIKGFLLAVFQQMVQSLIKMKF